LVAILNRVAVPYSGWRTEIALSCVFDYSFFGVEVNENVWRFDGLTPGGRYPNTGQTVFKLLTNEQRPYASHRQTMRRNRKPAVVVFGAGKDPAGSPTATTRAQSGRLGVHHDSCSHHRHWL